MDFKVTYLDAGLTSSYFSDGETPPSNGSATPANASTGNAKVPKRYKAHLRDFLSSCRGKRAKHTIHSPTGTLNDNLVLVWHSIRQVFNFSSEFTVLSFSDLVSQMD